MNMDDAIKFIDDFLESDFPISAKKCMSGVRLALVGNAFEPKLAGLPAPLAFYTIPGFPRYAVNKNGDVFGLHRKSVLKPWSTRGYLRVDIRDLNNKQKKPYIHDLVLAAFLGEKPEGMIVRHLNDDPSDNRLENLKYGNQKENTNDSIRNGRNKRKFSDEDMAEIMRLKGLGYKADEIIVFYPCSSRTMHKILSESYHRG